MCCCRTVKTKFLKFAAVPLFLYNTWYISNKRNMLPLLKACTLFLDNIKREKNYLIEKYWQYMVKFQIYGINIFSFLEHMFLIFIA